MNFLLNYCLSNLSGLISLRLVIFLGSAPKYYVGTVHGTVTTVGIESDLMRDEVT